MLDFARIRAEMQLPAGAPILETMATLGDARRIECERILIRHEARAAADSSLNPGCRDLLRFIDSRGLAPAVITRNSRATVAAFEMRHGIRFAVSIARDECAFKPDPAPLVLACERLGVMPADAWMIGDGRYDIEAGLGAGMRTVWLSHGRQREFGAQPWRVVRDLPELQALIASEPQSTSSV
jgi:HAD superfamily hydrolase (TIGR01549 family)